MQEPSTETGLAQPTPTSTPTEPMPNVESAFEEIEVDAPLVGIIMGSKNDKPKLQPAGQALQDIGIRYEVRVMSAHRDPEKVRGHEPHLLEHGTVVDLAGVYQVTFLTTTCCVPSTWASA